MKDIAEVIQIEMGKRGWDVPMLALKSGVPAQTIYRIVKREVASPRVDTITALANALRLTEAQIRGLDTVEDVPSITREEPRYNSRERTIDKKLEAIIGATLKALESIGKPLSDEEVADRVKWAIDQFMKSELSQEKMTKIIQITWED